MVPLCILAVIIGAVVFYQLGRTTVLREHPDFASQEQASLILAKVGALIQLPQGETPTMATIDDAVAAKKAQPFLQNSANGDVLIIYPNAKIAILFRPSTDKLIAVGPVNSDTQQTAGQVQNASGSTASTTQNANANATKK